MKRRFTYPLKIVERRHLNVGSPDAKETHHIVLDLTDTPIQYKPGDCLAIYPHNSKELVQKLIEELPFESDCDVLFSEQQTVSLEEFLTIHVNLGRCSKRLIEYVGNTFPHPLEAFRSADFSKLSIHELPELFMKQLPRFYSICSSMKHVGQQAHLIVALAKNPEGAATEFGTCSDFLCKRAPLNQAVISAYHHEAPHFFLPEDSTAPIIMIGPGTGIAPFRGFMQERVAHNHPGKNWLFFGEKRQAHDYFYQEEWATWEKLGKLQVDTAFSRDFSDKVYVQHKILEKSKQVWDWISQGAYLYICGDAKHMAKAVDAALKEVFVKEGHFSMEEATSYLKQLRAEKRYQRDVY